MKVEMLISTMNQENLNFFNEMNISTKSVIINQITKDSLNIPLKIENEQMVFLSLNDKGLSKSRNMALKNATADICVVCDDDMKYINGYEKVILNEYKENPDVDIIVFQVKKSDGSLYKKYSKRKKLLNFITAMKVSSVEITFKKKSIENNRIIYNELFGAGSKFFMGEESIFLSECIKKGLKVMFVPKTIGYLTDSESTWFKGFNSDYFRVKGACFYAMTPFFYWLLIFQFAIRKYKLYKKDINLLDALKLMYVGKREYVNLINKN
ncbi:glycosyltransferase family A protein [Peribacillus simplex]|uniref:glycosyltransferase family A protein n=1 Tax=Peribacillus simplex TaxID=1478 RepID=UPI003266DF31